MGIDQIKQTIREHAAALGFVRCHFTLPALDQRHAEALDHWVEAGMQGDMAWMGEAERLNRRKEPTSMLPQVRTVISLLMPYTPPDYSLEVASAAKQRGVISAYAHGDDYHDVMKKRLKQLAEALNQLLGEHDQRVYVDTAPVLEHALAEQGGLAWQGKHSLSLTRELGSWFLLGEIFTTAAITPDTEAAAHCGSCTACIDGCPTAAIVAPYVVDSRRCISYLTIEHRGTIPLELRPLIGNRIYGCDDCQMLCPWNAHVATLAHDHDDLLAPKGENRLPDLVSLLHLDDDGFRHRFRRTPVKRIKRAGLLRNVCVAMGNSGDAAMLDHLLAVIADPEPMIRAHAAWAVGRLCHADATGAVVKKLEQHIEKEREPLVAVEFAAAVREIRMKI